MKLQNLTQSASRLPTIKLTLIFMLGAFLYLTSDLDKPDWYNRLDEEEIYGLYNLLRFVIFAAFALLAYSDFKKQDKTMSIIWAASALLINPIIQVKLGKTIWHICDWSWIAIIIGTLIYQIPRSTIGLMRVRSLALSEQIGLRIRGKSKELYDISQRRYAPHEWAWDKSDTDTVMGCAVSVVVLIIIVGIISLIGWLLK